MRITETTLAFLLIAFALAMPSRAQNVTPDNMVGRYEATTLEVTTESGETINAYCLGGYLRVNFTADQIVGGEALMPDTLGLRNEPIDLRGTYEIMGDNTIEISTETETFINGVPLMVEPGGIMTTSVSTDSTSYQIEFQRQ